MLSSKQNFKKLLLQHTANDYFHTHVSMVNPKGKFHFDRYDVNEFWNHYMKDIKSGTILGIAEKPEQYIPVLGDIDISILANDSIDYEKHLYSEEQCISIIKIFQSMIRKYVSKCSDVDLLCVLLEKDIYTKNNNENTYMKNGFHIHFPNLFLNKNDIETYLFPEIKKIYSKTKNI